ncbi:MAG: hypothetical protein ACRDY2_00775 [Acidimicrobiales bacterium]
MAPNSSANLPDLGSTLGLVSTNTGAVSVWTDTREGTILSGKQDLGSQLISITVRSHWRTPLEALGWVLEALGLAALVVAGLTWRHHRRVEPETIEEPLAG